MTDPTVVLHTGHSLVSALLTRYMFYTWIEHIYFIHTVHRISILSRSKRVQPAANHDAKQSDRITAAATHLNADPDPQPEMAYGYSLRARITLGNIPKPTSYA